MRDIQPTSMNEQNQALTEESASLSHRYINKLGEAYYLVYYMKLLKLVGFTQILTLVSFLTTQEPALERKPTF